MGALFQQINGHFLPLNGGECQAVQKWFLSHSELESTVYLRCACFHTASRHDEWISHLNSAQVTTRARHHVYHRGVKPIRWNREFKAHFAHTLPAPRNFHYLQLIMSPHPHNRVKKACDNDAQFSGTIIMISHADSSRLSQTFFFFFFKPETSELVH